MGRLGHVSSSASRNVFVINQTHSLDLSHGANCMFRVAVLRTSKIDSTRQKSCDVNLCGSGGCRLAAWPPRSG